MTLETDALCSSKTAGFELPHGEMSQLREEFHAHAST
jgi:hypothetical protein